MTTDSDLLRKISALLSKAEGTDNENEAEAFFSKARELMLRHSIDEMAVRANLAKSGQAEKPVLVDYMFSTNDSNAVGKAALLNVVAKNLGVRMLIFQNSRYSNQYRPGNQGVASQWCALVGFQSDIEAVKVLYLSLLIQDMRFAKHDWKAYGETRGESKFRTGHLYGFSGRVGQRLAEAKGRVVEETSSSALVVVRDQEVNAAFTEAFPRTKTSHHRVDFAGSVAGRSAAERADIGNARVGASSVRSLGAGR